MNLNQPLVSILAICYNHERFVEETLSSIKNQTYNNIELVIIDDCSTDNSAKVIDEWISKSEFNCQFIKHTVNTNLCKTLNEGANLCKGEYLQFMACDDLLEPDKIENQINCFQTLDANYALIYSDVFIIDDHSKKKEKTFYQRNPFFIAPQGYVYYAQINTQFIKGVSCLFRMNLMREIGLFDEELSFEDVDLYLRLAEKYNFHFYDMPTARWREHDGNMTNSLYVVNSYLISRFLAYRKHVLRGNKTADGVLIKRMENIFLNLYKNGFFYHFDAQFLQHLKLNNNLLYFCYHKKIPYRAFLLIFETKTFIRNFFRYLFTAKKNLPTPQ
jgi:glycosyltransferase involved in cell wall biosynthesis